MKINKMSTILGVLLAFFFALTAWLSFKLIDISISYTYLEESLDSDNSKQSLLINLLMNEFGELSELELRNKLEHQINKSDKDIILKKEESRLIYENIIFHIYDGKLKDIE